MSLPSTIGRVAKTLSLNIETIRYYERLGLIAQPEKPKQGYRVYPTKTVQRLQFIKRAKELGFSLSEIENLLQLGDSHCEGIQEIAESKLNTIRLKIADLENLKSTLEDLTIQCQSNPERACCPIVEALLPNS
tara:strand:+ start:3379 stop:3777 length:399 start_codon:yes stop_codon:yes gene_type:complete